MSWKKRYSSLFRVNQSRGMVLIMALWALFFLGALALAIAAYVRPQLSLAGRIKDRALVHWLAQAGGKRVMAQISHAPYDFKPQGSTDGGFSCGLVDEERKININTASDKVLERLFEIIAQLDPQEAGDMAAAILDWREPGENPRKNGAKSNYYQALSPSYPCKDGLFDVPEEVLLVKGMTPDIFKSIKDEITVYGAGSVNINTADQSVLEVLGMSGALAGQIINFRNSHGGLPAGQDVRIFTDAGSIVNTLQSAQKLAQEDVRPLTNIVGEGLLCVRSDHFRGRAHAKALQESLTVDIVFTRGGSIAFWREE